LNKDPAYSVAVGGYESRSRETRNRQQLMSKLIAPFPESIRDGVSTQKSAEGIVGHLTEGLNAEKSEAIS